MMLALDQKKFEEVLLSLQVVSKEDLEKAKIESVRSGKSLDSVIFNLNFASEENTVKAKAIAMQLPYVDLTNSNVGENVLKYIPKEAAKRYLVAPFGIAGTTINVAMVNPNNVQALEYIERKTNLRVVPYMASQTGIMRIISQYADVSSEVSEALKSIDIKDEGPTATPTEKKGELGELVQDAPVTRAVNTILEYAAKSRVSDVHIEPWENALKIRYRIDGILQETMSLPVHIQAALVSRIKILSDLKIDEHRLPQDGRFGINVDGHEIDIRVAVSPTVHGEKVVLRLLDKSNDVMSLEELGLRGKAFELVSEGSKRPHGMVLATGPTGSGKTTSLYAILSKLNKPNVNIITLEDPVEYQVQGVNQIQVNAPIGLTFASGLRSILRQDPDIMMVGEIRDAETADLAVQSALTGHLVLSTLHTNNAAGVLPRLLDMKIEPFLIASTVNTCVGQRLVRKLCQKCREKYQAGPALDAAITKSVGKILPKNKKEAAAMGYPQLPLSGSTNFNLWRAKGCSACNGTGYFGRIGMFEVFNMNGELEKYIVARATTFQIQQEVVRQGMITMRQDGFLKALEGITSIEEVLVKSSEV